jgi:mannose-1-phosphate guanylyltransferase
VEKNDIFAVIMAGGKGERFWPQSRTSKPKQLLRLIGNLTLIEQTVDRLTPLVPHKNIIIITNEDYVAPMQSLLEDVPKENIIGEPMGRDTAPCIALAAAIVASKTDNPDAVMVVLPADHVINDTEAMVNVLKDCAEVAQKGNIVTIGVNPSYPSTGYGYIKCGPQIESGTDTNFYESGGFREKPDAPTATNFLEAGCYRWNSGMFAWSVSTIMKAFEEHAPELAKGADIIRDAITQDDFERKLKIQYELFEKISIDYAVMEKVDNVVVAECTFDWDDVGSWTALRNQIRPSENNNVIQATHIGLDTKDCIIVGESNHLISTIDVEDLIIVNTEDATLICKSKSAQRVKEIVHMIADKPEFKGYL